MKKEHIIGGIAVLAIGLAGFSFYANQDLDTTLPATVQSVGEPQVGEKIGGEVTWNCTRLEYDKETSKYVPQGETYTEPKDHSGVFSNSDEKWEIVCEQ